MRVSPARQTAPGASLAYDDRRDGVCVGQGVQIAFMTPITSAVPGVGGAIFAGVYDAVNIAIWSAAPRKEVHALW